MSSRRVEDNGGGGGGSPSSSACSLSITEDPDPEVMTAASTIMMMGAAGTSGEELASSSGGGGEVTFSSKDGNDLGFEKVPDSVGNGDRTSLSSLTSSVTQAESVPKASSTIIIGSLPMDPAPGFEALCNQVIGEGLGIATTGTTGEGQLGMETMTFFAGSPSPPVSSLLGKGEDSSNVTLDNTRASSIPDMKKTLVHYLGGVSPTASETSKYQATWTQVNDPPAIGFVRPEPRHGHRAVSYGHLMIVVGGGTPTPDNKGKVHVFDTSKNVWFQPKLSGEIPCERAAFGMDVDGSRILVHGGIFGEDCFGDDLYQLSIPNWEWRKLSPLGPTPCGRLGHSFTLVWDKIYVFGGLAKDEDEKNSNWHQSSWLLNDLHILHVRLNDEEGVWTQPATYGRPPNPRESHTAVAYTSHYGGYKNLILYGGVGKWGRLGDVNILNLASNAWTRPELRGVPPSPISLHSATMIGDKMYVFGGMGTWMEEVDDEMKEVRYCSKSFAYLNVETLHWEHPDHIEGLVSRDPPSPRAGHSAVLINSSIYIWSGRDCLKKTVAGRQICFPDLWKVEVPAPPTTPRNVQDGDSDSDSKWVKIGWNPVPSADGDVLEHDKVKVGDSKALDHPPATSSTEVATGDVHSPPKVVTPPGKAQYCPVTSPITPPTPASSSSPPSGEPSVKEVASETDPSSNDPVASSSVASFLPPTVTYVPIYTSAPCQASSSTPKKWRWLEDYPTQSSVSDPFDFNFVCEQRQPPEDTSPAPIPPDMSGISMLAEAAARHESQSTTLLSPADLVEQLQIATGLSDDDFDTKIMGPAMMSPAPEYTATQLFQGVHLQVLKDANRAFHELLAENIFPIRMPISPPTTPSPPTQNIQEGIQKQVNYPVRESVIKFGGVGTRAGSGCEVLHDPEASTSTQDQNQIEAPVEPERPHTATGDQGAI